MLQNLSYLPSLVLSFLLFQDIEFLKISFYFFFLSKIFEFFVVEKKKKITIFLLYFYQNFFIIFRNISYINREIMK